MPRDIFDDAVDEVRAQEFADFCTAVEARKAEKKEPKKMREMEFSQAMSLAMEALREQAEQNRKDAKHDENVSYADSYRKWAKQYDEARAFIDAWLVAPAPQVLDLEENK